MATGQAILDSLRDQTRPDRLPEAPLGGHRSRSTWTSSSTTPGVTRTAYQRLYDMILVARHRGGVREQGEGHPLTSSSPSSPPGTATPSTASTGR